MQPNGALNLLRTHPRVKWVPTLSAYHTLNERKGHTPWEDAHRVLKKVTLHVETRASAHGRNALEMKLMAKLADWRQVFKWATLGGWE